MAATLGTISIRHLSTMSTPIHNEHSQIIPIGEQAGRDGRVFGMWCIGILVSCSLPQCRIPGLPTSRLSKRRNEPGKMDKVTRCVLLLLWTVSSPALALSKLLSTRHSEP